MTDDQPDTEDLKHVSNAVADANDAAAKAVTRSVDVPTTPAPVGRLWNTRDALCETLRQTRRALVQTERMLGRFDHAKATSKQITSEHADRIKETYDGPVLDIALMLLEHNRRKWLHERPNANGAEEVKRHGLTATQRERLNELQEAYTEADR